MSICTYICIAVVIKTYKKIFFGRVFGLDLKIYTSGDSFVIE
jgi:hypothetical protein